MAVDTQSTLTWMGEGAALGTALMPGIGTAAGAALGGLASVAASVFPSLEATLQRLGPDNAGAALVPAFKEVLGTADPTLAATALAANPQLAVDLRVRLAQIAQEGEAARLGAVVQAAALENTDRADARGRQVKLNDWTTPCMAGSVTLGFFAMMAIFAFKTLPQANETAFNILLGSLGGSYVTVIAYYFGSSAGSARKDLAK